MEVQPAVAIDGTTLPGLNWRRAFASLVGEGVDVANGADDMRVTQNLGTDRKVKIAVGGAWVTGDSAAHQGRYYIFNDADVVKDIAAADVTNPRLDIVIAQIHDPAYGAGDNLWSFQVIAGTPAGSPVAPAVPNSALLLATVSVPANDTTITNDQITDNRTAAVQGAAVFAKVYRSTDFNVPDGAATVIPWNAEDEDAFGFHASGAGTLVVPVGYGGLFAVKASVQWENNANAYRRMELFRTPNAGVATTIAREHGSPPGSTNNFAMPPIEFEGRLLDLDAVDLRCHQGSGGGLKVMAGIAQSWMVIRRIGD
jgi:hypothetical protein